MANSAIVFSHARPVSAQLHWVARPEPSASDPELHWAPAIAGAAICGDLGYTTGPWFMSGASGLRTAQGQFFTIWARQADGTYRWLLDNGISYPAPTGPMAPLPSTVHYLTAGTAPARKVSPTAPAALDAELTLAIARQGLTAYLSRLHPQARLLREGLQPLSPGTVPRWLAIAAPYRFITAGGGRAQSGDMAYTYGRYEAIGPVPTAGSYVHLWQHEPTGWKLLAEIFNPTTE